jgi:hypothetical protein
MCTFMIIQALERRAAKMLPTHFSQYTRVFGYIYN